MSVVAKKEERMEIRNPEEIKEKIEKSKEIIKEAYQKYGLKDMAVAFTGGKDSTLMLHIIAEACKEMGKDLPQQFCIDEGDVFDEIRDFIKETDTIYGTKTEFLHNSDVSQAAGGKLGAPVKVSDLNERNQKEITRLEYDKDEFPYEPESYVGNHLMKTVSVNMYIDDKKIKAFFEGIRWDEQGARESEVYFSPREGNEFNLAHDRICPILHFTEREVWEAHFYADIPINILYQQGYRSLGARVTTKKLTDVPAWLQDMENTIERGGRRQDKEGVMGRLRKLGYM